MPSPASSTSQLPSSASLASSEYLVSSASQASSASLASGATLALSASLPSSASLSSSASLASSASQASSTSLALSASPASSESLVSSASRESSASLEPSASLLQYPASSVPLSPSSTSLETVPGSLSTYDSEPSTHNQPTVIKTAQESSVGLLPSSQNPFLYQNNIDVNNMSKNYISEENSVNNISESERGIPKDNWDQTHNENSNHTVKKLNKIQKNSTVYNMNLEVLEDDSQRNQLNIIDTVREQHYLPENQFPAPIANQSINQGFINIFK